MGKVLCILAAIITALATYVFYWTSYEYQELYYLNGVGFLENIVDLFVNYNSYAVLSGLPLIFYYAFIVLLILLIAAPALQLLGIKARIGSVLGCITPLLIGIGIILYTTLGIDFLMKPLLLCGDIEPLVEGVFPLTIAIQGRAEYWGTYLLLLGGVLTLISALKGPTEF